MSKRPAKPRAVPAPKKGQVAFEVRFTMPPGATLRGAQEYVHSAVSGWCGGYGGLMSPDLDTADLFGDPMSELDRDSVVVTPKRAR